MNSNRLMRIAKNVVCLAACGITVDSARAKAQSDPPTIPTVVAHAMSFGPQLFGKPQYFSGRTPTDWPSALTPPAAKILGGGLIGDDSAMFRMRVAVFEFPAQSNPGAALDNVIALAGYTPPAPAHPKTNGFAETASAAPTGQYCKGSKLAAFGPVDSVRIPLTFAVYLIEGEAGRESCGPHRNAPITQSFPAAVPQLSPPPGTMSYGGGTSWSGASGYMSSTLRTTMPTDSLLKHYSAQLTAGGWKAEGVSAIAGGVGVQRFSFRDGDDAWRSALLVFDFGDKREIVLQITRND